MKYLVLILILLPATLFADFVEVQRNAKIYRAPTTTSTVLRHIRIDEEPMPVRFPIAQASLKNGFHNVEINSAGDTGWVFKSRVRRFSGGLTLSNDDSRHVFAGLPDHSDLDEVVSVVSNTGYIAGFSEAKWTPLWVSYFLGPEQPHHCDRLRRFLVDDRTDAKISHDDYTNSGYDRGHMAPSHNIGSRYGCNAQRETYLMSNIVPQIPLLNQRPWGAFERKVSSDYAQEFDGVWVTTGPIFSAEEATLLCSEVEVPAAFYKIVLREDNGEPDVLAIITDQTTQPGVTVRQLVTTVDDIEEQTGIDFFSDLPNSLESTLESQSANDNDWDLDDTLDTSFRPTARTFCQEGPIDRADLVF